MDQLGTGRQQLLWFQAISKPVRVFLAILKDDKGIDELVTLIEGGEKRPRAKSKHVVKGASTLVGGSLVLHS